MSIAYVRVLSVAGEFTLVEVIPIGPGSPPERPHPQPPLGIWGPTDPRPTHPIALPGLPGWPEQPEPPLGIWGPTDPRPTHPIAGIPGFPGYTPPGSGGGPSFGTDAKIIVPPAQTPPVTPPAGLPPDSAQILILVPGAPSPIVAWVPPYVSTGPITPPPTGTTPPPGGTTPPPSGIVAPPGTPATPKR